mmetsp:Transcript_78219/g.211620  ORF Transcript_78219/g.211620 Transcript_78219/m.211620 type:complete len:434 (-) Transcript_78219:428-1729(-)
MMGRGRLPRRRRGGGGPTWKSQRREPVVGRGRLAAPGPSRAGAGGRVVGVQVPHLVPELRAPQNPPALPGRFVADLPDLHIVSHPLPAAEEYFHEADVAMDHLFELALQERDVRLLVQILHPVHLDHLRAPVLFLDLLQDGEAGVRGDLHQGQLHVHVGHPAAPIRYPIVVGLLHLPDVPVKSLPPHDQGQELLAPEGLHEGRGIALGGAVPRRRGALRWRLLPRLARRARRASSLQGRLAVRGLLPPPVFGRHVVELPGGVSPGLGRHGLDLRVGIPGLTGLRGASRRIARGARSRHLLPDPAELAGGRGRGAGPPGLVVRRLEAMADAGDASSPPLVHTPGETRLLLLAAVRGALALGVRGRRGWSRAAPKPRQHLLREGLREEVGQEGLHPRDPLELYAPPGALQLLHLEDEVLDGTEQVRLDLVPCVRL